MNGPKEGFFRGGLLDVDDNPAVRQSSDLMNLIAHSGRLEIRDRFFHLRRYRATFLGSELVDLLSGEFAIGRSESIRIGQRLLALELISHSNGEHDFKDQPLFYVVGNGKQEPVVAELSFSAVHQLAIEMRGASGIRAGTRRRWFVDYPMCFSGQEVVDWVSTKTNLPRDAATSAGRAMLRGNLIRHVLDDQPFHDGNHFYRFV